MANLLIGLFRFALTVLVSVMLSVWVQSHWKVVQAGLGKWHLDGIYSRFLRITLPNVAERVSSVHMYMTTNHPNETLSLGKKSSLLVLKQLLQVSSAFHVELWKEARSSNYELNRPLDEESVLIFVDALELIENAVHQVGGPSVSQAPRKITSRRK